MEKTICLDDGGNRTRATSAASESTIHDSNAFRQVRETLLLVSFPSPYDFGMSISGAFSAFCGLLAVFSNTLPHETPRFFGSSSSSGSKYCRSPSPVPIREPSFLIWPRFPLRFEKFRKLLELVFPAPPFIFRNKTSSSKRSCCCSISKYQGIKNKWRA